MTTTRRCRTPECPNARYRHRTLCGRCIHRQHRYGHPQRNHDDINHDDVDIVVRERRPAAGLTRAERQLVSRKLTANGLSAAEIARILCVNERTITRWRKADRVARGAEPVPVGGARRSLAAPPGSQESHPAPFAPHAHAQAAA